MSRLPILLLFGLSTGFSGLTALETDGARLNKASMDLLDDHKPIQAGDKISIRVLEDRRDASQYKVPKDGMIVAPYIGRIKASGLTSRKLAHEISRKLKAAPVDALPFLRSEVPVVVVAFDGLITSCGPPRMEDLDNAVKLMPGRIIGIQILEDKRVELQQVIAVTGEIQAPYLGLTKAAGMTCRELAYKLKTELEKSFFKQATLVVILGRDMAHGRIVCPDLEFVVAFGVIAKQGKYDFPSDSDLTVLGLLHRAGVDDSKKKISAIRIARKSPQGNKTILVNTKAILVEKNYEYDLFLRPYDVVFFE